MAVEAVFGFAGVLIGSLTTSVLTIYKERWASRPELEVRELPHERERRAARDTFQRDSVLALQVAATELLEAAYAELDRLLAVEHETGVWSRRNWETPTAVGWSAALLALETSRARVFDDDLRTAAGNAIWAESLDDAKTHSQEREPLLGRFNTGVTRVLPTLY